MHIYVRFINMCTFQLGRYDKNVETFSLCTKKKNTYKKCHVICCTVVVCCNKRLLFLNITPEICPRKRCYLLILWTYPLFRVPRTYTVWWFVTS